MISGMKKYLLATLLLIISITAYAQVCSYLVDSWIDDNGNQMCEYDDGTVLNKGRGMHFCPMSINCD
ncbi:MAG: hypothetical protein Ct9H300mP4_05290 [Gammaproteobacteria bacterium]|nr:MAG: hypothetical protein Ct9H300mP4_05290 [Gammaproteobacteria bacterium]